MSEELWLKRLQRSITAIRGWEPRMGEHELVAPGSSLAKDDEGLIGNPVRSAARYGLITAVDHLGLIADLAKDELTLRPSAIFTPARAALLGSSQAVWILTGKRTQRIDRSLAVALDERIQHRTFIRDHLNDAYIKGKSTDFLDDLRRVDGELTGEISRLELLRKGTAYSGRFDTTRMMREAAAHLTKAGEVDDQWMRLALSYEWRIASAAAHARSWTMQVRKTETLSSGVGGDIRRMTSSVEEFAKSVGVAVLMTSEAWRLWDLRREKHTK